MGFLNNLKIEVRDAQKGIGKPVVKVEKLCNTVYRLLNTLEDNMEVTFYIGLGGLHRISDIEIDLNDKSLFEEIIFELNEKHIIGHKADFPIKRNNILQSNLYLKEMIDGKNIVIRNKKGFRQYVDLVKKIIDNINKKEHVKNYRKVAVNNEDSQVKELVIGPLVYCLDGSICFKNKILKIRPQMKTLCIFFMKNHKKSVDYSTIKDEIIDAKKRSYTTFKTITKYVSELHNLLRKHFKKNVIIPNGDQGYIFDTGVNS